MWEGLQIKGNHQLRGSEKASWLVFFLLGPCTSVWRPCSFSCFCSHTTCPWSLLWLSGLLILSPSEREEWGTSGSCPPLALCDAGQRTSNFTLHWYCLGSSFRMQIPGLTPQDAELGNRGLVRTLPSTLRWFWCRWSLTALWETQLRASEDYCPNSCLKHRLCMSDS